MENESGKNFGASIHFLRSILDKATSFSEHLDTQLNILIGVSVAIFAFTATKFGINREASLFDVIGFFSAASATVALLAVHPPKFMRKRGQAESLMYNKRIIEFESPLDYQSALIEVMRNNEHIIQQYASETYNLYKYYYRPKRRLYKIARNLLMLGVILSLLIAITNYLHLY